MLKTVLRAILQLGCGAALLIILALLLGNHKPPDQWIPLTIQMRTNMDLFLLDVPHHLAANLTRDSANQEAPALSPDNQWLTYTVEERNRYNIHLMNIFGGDGRALPSISSYDVFAAWSPDSQQIVFASGESATDIYVRNLNTNQVRRLTDTFGSKAIPVWSPDGKWIVYVAGRSGDPASLYAIPADCPASCDSLAHTLTGTAANELFPAWSPDGKWIAYIADQNNQRDIDVLDTTCLQQEMDCSQQPQQLLAHVSFSTTQLSWTQDSQQVIFHAEHNGFPAIYMVDVACISIQGGCRPTLWTTLLER